MNRWIGRMARGALVALVGAGLPAWADPALWEVADARGQVRAHVFGTVHLCNATCFPLPAPVRAAFERADTLAVELDMRDPAVAATLLRAGSLPAGETLETRLPADLYADLSAAAARVGVPVQHVRVLQPWFASSLLVAMAAIQAGYSTDAAVDSVLQARAGRSGKALVALESAQRQVAALAGGGDGAQHAAMRQTLDMINQNQLPDYLGRVLAAWKSGDAAQLAALMFEGVDENAVAPLFAELIDRRNAEMSARIDALLVHPGVLFVAVGGGHLVGEGGIPARLAARGWQVRQVSPVTRQARGGY